MRRLTPFEATTLLVVVTFSLALVIYYLSTLY
jgi:hypothetical protein